LVEGGLDLGLVPAELNDKPAVGLGCGWLAFFSEHEQR